MRRPLVFLVFGFIAGALALTAFLTATGKLTLNRAASPATTSLPPLAPDVTHVPSAPATAESPALPDPSAFTPPLTQAPLPPLTQGDPLHPLQPSTSAASPAPPDPSTFAPATSIGQAAVQILNSRSLKMPIAGLQRANIQDTFNEKRGTDRIHEATDILAPRGTPVVAIDEGNVAKLFTSKPGGLTVYQFDNKGIYCYYYAHLDRYADGLKEGMLLRKGDKVGYVGTTGNADPKTPHLHFAIFKLGPEKHYWKGTPIDPYPVLMHILGG
ncbi:MAG: peptidoglycan DD-metalloendopeptidase family protein [Acidobacteriota bacterium]|nr:peptidoglycan DD-metalloendopeptidase family protein [Acidobacteriota bacterium]